MSDAQLQVAPDGAGKMVDMDLTSTAAGTAIYRQRAVLVGDTGNVLCELLANSRAQLAVLRAILETLQATSNVQISEDDFPPP